MNEIIEFFIAPYREASTFNIILEIIAMSFGIASVIFAKRESILVYPVGIISTAIYVYLLSKWGLYGDLIINIYYTVMSIYGWYVWTRITSDNEPLHVTQANKKDWLYTFGIFLFTSVFVIVVYRYFKVMPTDLTFSETLTYVSDNLFSGELNKIKKITPYLDTFTTGAAFAAMWLMANKKLESWTFWIAVNMVSIPLYFIKGLGFTGIQYLIFLILAIYGYKAWKNSLDNTNQI
jgi:nicotinamide mononucleotide transporter